MPFSWYDPEIPEEYANAGQKAERMYILELGERAALLRRLGYTKKEVTARLRANLKWDFEMNASPAALLKQIKKVVDGVFARRGLAGGGPPSL